MTMTMSAYQHVKTGKKIFGGHVPEKKRPNQIYQTEGIFK